MGTGVDAGPLLAGQQTLRSKGGKTVSENQLRLGNPQYGLARKPGREPDPIWDALVDVFGEPSPNRRALYNRVRNYLTEQEASPDEVRRRCMALIELWGIKALTISALEKHWSRWDGLVGKLTPGEVAAFQVQQQHDDYKKHLASIDWTADD